MNKYFVTIGLEIHIVLNTKTKMFSNALSIHNDGINNHINEIDLALPGAMPALNANSVKKGIRLAHALHMQINTTPITFDRKNYYYWDLPKGFQITQQFNPIGSNGYVILDNEQQSKINIERIQLEEDTAKQIKIENSNNLLLNYNRAGMPLIEIVSYPNMHSASEVMLYLTALREICLFMDISDAKMEEGSMRVDVNISLSKDANKLGTKVEVKNINSINNAALAVEYEIKRQSALLDNNEVVNQETRRFDDTTNTTIFMRKKDNVIDYKYMTEPNILAIDVPQNFLDDVLNNLPTQPYEIRQTLKQNNLSNKDINLILSDKKIYQLFNEVYLLTNDYKDACRWILNELMGILNKQEKTINDLSVKQIADLFAFIKDYKANKFNSKQAKDLFNEIFANNQDYHVVLSQLLANQQSFSEADLQKMFDDILSNNPKTKEELQTRFDKAEKFLMGQIMKQTKGQVNPLVIKNLILKLKN